MVVGVGGKIDEGLHERLAELLGDLPQADTGEPECASTDAPKPQCAGPMVQPSKQ